MKSMTGYGRGVARNERLEVTVEVSSVNRKSLDISVSLPKDWQGMERSLQEVVRNSLQRGKVSVFVKVEDLEKGRGLDWDDAQLANTLNRLEGFATANRLPFEANGELLLRIVTAMGNTSELPAWEDGMEVVANALGAALQALTDMRTKEGAALQADFNLRLEKLREQAKEIAQRSEGTVERYRELLFQRLQRAKLELDLQDDRVLKELALFADRCDIAEELTRLNSHFEQFEATVSEGDAIGRKLDFLCQELNREINTVGSKANNIDITRCVIECKNELERIREQVQNVE